MLVQALALGALASIGLALRRSRARAASCEDPVTGLAGVRAFHDALATCLAEGGPQTETFAVLVLSVCRYDRLRRELGRSALEELVSDLAERMRRRVGAEDLCARLDDSVLAVLLSKNHGALRAPEVAHYVAGRIELVTLIGRRVAVDVNSIIVIGWPGGSLQVMDSVMSDAESSLSRTTRLHGDGVLATELIGERRRRAS